MTVGSVDPRSEGSPTALAVREGQGRYGARSASVSRSLRPVCTMPRR